MIFSWRKVAVAIWLFLGVATLSPFMTLAVEDSMPVEAPHIYMFGRDDCGYCQSQKAFMDAEGLPYHYLNIVTDAEAEALYAQVIEKHSLTRATPISVVGEEVFFGWNGERTTGVALRRALARAAEGDIRTPEDHLARAPISNASFAGGCSEVGCTEGEGVEQFVFDLPYFGVVDLKTFSLFSLSLILGVIDGFNPCAMWVLVTFLVLLSQAGSRQKMIFLAGLFIIAQGLMYNLILNVWYKTWDFVALDQFVTPLVGFLALGGGAFFLYRWRKNRDAALVCDITDLETQSKTITRFKKIVEQPFTLASIVAILVIAFSVNVIEFACSVGIPQAYTKILELNMLSFLERQWFIFVFTLGYMFDDFVVFALAIWGYSRLQAHGGTYAQHSLLIGGILMLLLGALLIINPSVLVL